MIFSLQTSGAPAATPARRPARMSAQPIIPWTPAAMVRAMWEWLWEETLVPEREMLLTKVVGERGFEPPAPTSRT